MDPASFETLNGCKFGFWFVYSHACYFVAVYLLVCSTVCTVLLSLCSNVANSNKSSCVVSPASNEGIVSEGGFLSKLIISRAACFKKSFTEISGN